MTPRGIWLRGAVVLGLAALMALPAMDASAAGKIRTKHAPLVFATGARTRRAAGQVTMTVDDRRRHHEVLTIAMHGLVPGQQYGLFCDDPATADRTPQEFTAVTANRNGRAALRYDSRRGDVFPCGAAIDALAGMRFEVRDDRRLLVIVGSAPVMLKSAAAFRFIETEVVADDFDADATGVFPTGWAATGASVTVDEAVKDGATGKSAKIDDVDTAADPPSMSRFFTAQDKFFAVEFTLISSATNGRVGFRLGKDDVGGPVFAGGFGDGLGFYEDGTIGFGIGDALVSYAPSTAYRFRVDVDVVAKKFDVLIDGAPVAVGRDLVYAGASLDRMFFGGATATTGTANVDTVAVVHKELDRAPVANAGPDRTVEATGPTTEVTLDGTASADPEGATLTYTWTGDFTEGTATGATPTVHFAFGTHVVTLVVNDGFFDSEPDTVTIDLADLTPPTLTVTGLPAILSPADGRLVRIRPTVTAVDLIDPNPVVALTITVSDCGDGGGAGNTGVDFAVVSADDFLLRAVNSGHGSGRRYHLVWTAFDASGNSSTLSADVVVPNDQGQSQGPDDADDDDGPGPGHGPGHGDKHGHGHHD
jgi:hypothetical protein